MTTGGLNWYYKLEVMVDIWKGTSSLQSFTSEEMQSDERDSIKKHVKWFL